MKKRIPIIEAMVLDALNESARRNQRQEIVDNICKSNGHVMRYSFVYGCFECQLCGKRSRFEDGTNYHNPRYDRD